MRRLSWKCSMDPVNNGACLSPASDQEAPYGRRKVMTMVNLPADILSFERQ
jgi:hypothetical protein